MSLPWRYILISLAIGLLSGAALGLFYSHSVTSPWTQKSAEKFLNRLDKELTLTDSQRTQIRSYLSANRDKLTTFQEDIRQSTRTEIRGLLTTEQQTRFDAMVARHDAKRKKQEGQS